MADESVFGGTGASEEDLIVIGERCFDVSDTVGTVIVGIVVYLFF